MLKKLSSYTFLLMGFVVLLDSCKKEYESAQSIDDHKIEDYISKNNVSATKDPKGTGFYYQVTTQGSGDVYKNTDSVRYSIVVKSLLNGTVYYTTPETSNLGTFVGYSSQLLGINVKGMLNVLNQMKAGGTGRVILPSYLAFGKNGYETLKIPSNEILDVTVKTYTESQASLDDKHINLFLIANKLTATKSPSGVYYILTTAGTGPPITRTSTITYNYTGRTFNGLAFQTADGAVSVLAGLAPGFSVLTNFKQGTVVRILIPSVLAYGAAGSRDQAGATILSGNECLDFDVEVTATEN
ncbi:FKBP-type peptidyl-prolyl cis-trans isomerase FkpA [Pedobacter sp. UYP24]